MEIVTSWERKARETIAINPLREGIAVEMVARITDLTVDSGAAVIGTIAKRKLNSSTRIPSLFFKKWAT